MKNGSSNKIMEHPSSRVSTGVSEKAQELKEANERLLAQGQGAEIPTGVQMIALVIAYDDESETPEGKKYTRGADIWVPNATSEQAALDWASSFVSRIYYKFVKLEVMKSENP
jgi:hypothetical protein